MGSQALGSEVPWADFGNALRKHRKASGWSQPKLMEELARQGIEVASQGTLSKWESGKQRPLQETVEVLEEIFDLPRGTLLHMLRYAVEDGSEVGERLTERMGDGIETGRRANNDPIIIEAKRKHFDDLLVVAATLQRQLLTPNVAGDPKDYLHRLSTEKRSTLWHRYSDSEGVTGIGCWVEMTHRDLFTSLCEHLPEVRAEYSRWQQCVIRMLNSGRALRLAIDSDCQDRTRHYSRAEVPLTLLNSPSDLIFDCVTKGGPLEMATLPNEVNGCWELRYDRYLCDEYGDCLAKGPQQILEGLQTRIQAMYEQYSECRQVADMHSLIDQANKGHLRIFEKLTKISLRRVFPGTCELCPDWTSPPL